MSKTVKGAMMRDYSARLNDSATNAPRDAMVISVRALKAVDNTKVRQGLAKKNIRITVVRNALARRTFKDTVLKPLVEFFTGPSALAYGGSSVIEMAREVVKLSEKYPALELKGAMLDGEVYSGAAAVKALSKLPTRTEAIGEVAGSLVGPGRTLAGLIRAIEEKLEKGEAISAA